MKSFEASAEIGSPPDRIWAILVDGVNYPDWDSGRAERRRPDRAGGDDQGRVRQLRPVGPFP